MASQHQAHESDTSSANAEVAIVGNEHLVALQRDDLGTARRDHISTHDIPDRHYGNVTAQDLERRRLVNRERPQSSQESERVAGWNDAWARLANDELIEEGLHDLNAGQTHRARLLAEIKSRPEKPGPRAAQEIASRGLGNRSRGTGRSGRGGTQMTLKPSRSARSRIPPSTIAEGPSRINLPALSKQSPISTAGRTGITVRLPSSNASRSTSSQSYVSRPGTQYVQFYLPTDLSSSFRVTLAIPAQFMSHALAANRHEASATTASVRKVASERSREDAATTVPAPLHQDAAADKLRKDREVATDVAASDSGKVARRQPQSSSQVTEAIRYDRPKPVMGTLIDEQSLPTMDKPKSPSNTEDLLGLQFEETKLANTSAFSSMNTTSTSDPLANTAIQTLRATLTWSLPKLRSESPEIRFILQSALAALEKTSGEVFAEQSIHAPRDDLANTVERNTDQWMRQLIEGTVPSKDPILGSGLSPSPSIASSDVMSPSRRTAALSMTAPRGRGPQLPAFLASASHYDDPAAASRAQYSGRTAALQTSPSAQASPTVPNLHDPARTRTRNLGMVDEDALVSSDDAVSHRSRVTISRNEMVPSQRVAFSSMDNGALPRFPTTGNRVVFSTGPRLPAFLANAQPPKDPGAAAREQYGNGI
ncbi:MAG: hypothetical protein L6R37_002792 [Teloschistes peruensis]|nr:MAG: hypothetical protein L6R37_002792 [Teloschistes peruensis]